MWLPKEWGNRSFKLRIGGECSGRCKGGHRMAISRFGWNIHDSDNAVRLYHRTKWWHPGRSVGQDSLQCNGYRFSRRLPNTDDTSGGRRFLHGEAEMTERGQGNGA